MRVLLRLYTKARLKIYQGVLGYSPGYTQNQTDERTFGIACTHRNSLADRRRAPTREVRQEFVPHFPRFVFKVSRAQGRTTVTIFTATSSPSLYHLSSECEKKSFISLKIFISQRTSFYVTYIVAKDNLRLEFVSCSALRNRSNLNSAK